MSSRFTFSCVIENKPFLIQQLFVWLETLEKNAKVDKQNIIVHLVGKLPADTLEMISERVHKVVAVELFHEESPHSNKIQQLAYLENAETSHVVLTDVDVAFTRRFVFSVESEKDVYAKIVDCQNPPIDIIQAVFAKSGLPCAETVNIGTPDFNEKALTLETNFNGGFYVIRTDRIKRLRAAWSKWAYWLIANKELLGDYAVHVDQVSFSMAMVGCGFSFESVSNIWNYPTHIDISDASEQPYILHYHSNVDSLYRLNTLGKENVDKAISNVNSTIDGLYKGRFDNKTFWSMRYEKNPDLGSGLGSRGECLEQKRNTLRIILQPVEHLSISDIGCGDGEVLRGFSFRKYCGYDLSSEATNLAAAKIPNSTFVLDKTELIKSDIGVCLDVLIHQPTSQEYYSTLDVLFENAKISCVVSGYDQPSKYDSPMIFFHEPLHQTLSKDDRIEYFFKVDEYRDVSMYYAKIKNEYKHKRDLSNETLNEVVDFVGDKRYLAGQLNVAHKVLGFFPDHSPRVIEYPWFAKQLKGMFNKDATFLDIGAGVSPIPLYLSAQGANLVTTDSHTMIRTLDNQEAWNEWGYLDYSTFDRKIRSFNIESQHYHSAVNIDAVYSVSVLEHVPATGRREILDQTVKWCVKGSILLISLDLIPDTNDLWNLSQGQVVDSHDVDHGTFESISEEITNRNFIISFKDIVRKIPGAQTDVAFIVAVKK